MIYLYDPHMRHEYVSRRYYDPMLSYAAANGIALQRTESLAGLRDCGVICDADYLTPDAIIRLKENACEIFAFSCIDSAYLSEIIRFTPEMLLINRIFMVSGVPRQNFSHATVIDNEFNITAQRRTYLPDEAWNRFDFMRSRGAIQPLPYLVWNNVTIPTRKRMQGRRNEILFRGGAHFLRVIAYLVALRAGTADSQSSFLLRDYFSETMNPQFRYCEECRDVFNQHGRFPYSPNPDNVGCTSIAKWGRDLDLSNPGNWNNRCPKSFHWLAEQFSKRHGLIDMDRFAAALNACTEDEEQHRSTIADVAFYADCKWEFSIYAAQRFWEASSVGTINLLPERANDQDYFPAMRDGEHYLTFGNDLIGLDRIGGRLDEISDNAYGLWEKWIRPDEHGISNNLLKHIFDTILTVRNV